MKEQRKGTSRRDFFKIGGLSTIPLLIPPMVHGMPHAPDAQLEISDGNKVAVNFIYDGPMFSPRAF